MARAVASSVISPLIRRPASAALIAGTLARPTAAPIVAVPTSAGGYGAGLGGVTALLAMLSSCASGLVVVGIDNGFGAACAVARILAPAAVVEGVAGRTGRS